MSPRSFALVLGLASAAATARTQPVSSTGPQDDGELRTRIEAALRRYFAAGSPGDPALRDVLDAARGQDDLLVEILRSKSFVAPAGPVARRGTIDSSYRFRDAAPDSPVADNAALLSGPAATSPAPLVVYVPDSTETARFRTELEEEAREHGRFVFLVPDEEQDNLWKPTLHEHRRHTGPLRDLLLEHPVDPDRVYFAGSGRGGHAAWAVGLLYADRFAGIFPCNGGPVCEGSYELSGGVFLENARSLAVHAVYNTSFDHGLEGCRYAARKFAEWGYRFEGVEEPRMRTMRVAEAMEELDGARRDPHPREIVKRFNHLDAGEHFWLRALERSPHAWDPAAPIVLRGKWPDDPLQRREKLWEHVQGQCARLAGSIRENRITITAQGVGKVRVYFDPELVDFRRKVGVTVNGKAYPPVAPERKVEVMLKHVHETGDTARLYWAFRDCPVPER